MKCRENYIIKQPYHISLLVSDWLSPHYCNLSTYLFFELQFNSTSWSISIFLHLHSTLKIPPAPFNIPSLNHALAPHFFSLPQRSALSFLPSSRFLNPSCIASPFLPSTSPNSFQHEIINGALGKCDKSINHLQLCSLMSELRCHNQFSQYQSLKCKFADKQAADESRDMPESVPLLMPGNHMIRAQNVQMCSNELVFI